MINQDVGSKYTQYAKDVIEGKVVACKYVIQACKRYISFFDKYHFNTSAVDRVENFLTKIKHYKGKSAGKYFTLSPFQYWIICSIFGFEKEDGTRLTRTCYIDMARKQGKSFFIACLGLYLLVGDGEQSAEVMVVANSAKQAFNLFDMALKCSKSIDPKGKHFKKYRDKIKFDKTNSIMQMLASDASKMDGYNPSAILIDEYHEATNADVYNVLRSGTLARKQPLIFIITTAGYNLFSPCFEMRTTITEILSGNKVDDSVFGAIYTLDDGDDWKDENNFIKCNPNLGITVTKEALQAEILDATNQPSQEIYTRTKNFNQWLNANTDTWINNQLLLDNSRTITPKDFIGKVTYIGIDLASVSDLTAVTMVAEENNKYQFYTKYYLPNSAFMQGENKERYKEWKRQAYITNTAGNVTDYDYILNDLLRWRNDGVLIEKIAYDSWNSTTFAINATENNLPMYPYSQSIGNFNRPTKEFERAIKLGKVTLDNNPVSRWCFSNVALKLDYNDNAKPVKAFTENEKIDGVISMLTAFGALIEQPSWNNTI